MTYTIIDTNTNTVVNNIVYDGSCGAYSVPEGFVMQEYSGLNIGQEVELVNGVYQAVLP